MPKTMKLYAKHLLIAWPGLVILTSLAGLLLDRTPINFLFDFPNSAPFFAGYVLAGGVAGYLANREDRSRAAQWVWLLPLLIFVWNSLAQLEYAGWAGVWVAEFSRNCQASECLGEAIGTAPLLSSVAYALGASLARVRKSSDVEALPRLS